MDSEFRWMGWARFAWRVGGRRTADVSWRTAGAPPEGVVPTIGVTITRILDPSSPIKPLKFNRSPATGTKSFG